MLSDFTLGPVIGRGATSVVYRAEHTRSGIRVALKALDATRGPNLRLVHAEIGAMARVEHAHLLRVLDHGLVTRPGRPLPVGTAWMAVDYASGGSLEGWMPEDWASAREVLLDLLAGLAHAHARGLLHRDLKPANLLRCTAEDARPGLKIADFGLAWVRDADQIARGGTPTYMAPEQNIRDGRLGPWTDLYAVGNLLFNWTTGRLPFLRDTVEETLEAQRDATLPAFEPSFSVPNGLSTLITQLLQKEPELRPSSAAWVAWALRRLPEPTFTRWVPVGEHAPESTPQVRSLTQGLGLGLLPMRDFPVIGRDLEQKQLWKRMGPMQKGRSQVVVLSGPRGVGAERLCTWMVRRAHETGTARVFSLVGGRVKDLISGEVGERAPQWVKNRSEPAVLLVDPVMKITAIDLITTLLLERPDTPVLLLGPGADGDFDWSPFELSDGFLHLRLAPIAPKRLLAFAHDGLGLAYDLAADLTLLADGFVARALELTQHWVEDDRLHGTPAGLATKDGKVPSWPVAHGRKYENVLKRFRQERTALELFAELHAVGAVDRFEQVLQVFDTPYPTALLTALVEEGWLHLEPLTVLEPGLLTHLTERSEESPSAGARRIAMAVDMPMPARGLLLFRAGQTREAVELLTTWVASEPSGVELQLTARRMRALGFEEHGGKAERLAGLTQVSGRALLDGPFTTRPDLERLLAGTRHDDQLQRLLHRLATRLYWFAERFDEAEAHLHLADFSPVDRKLRLGLILMDAGRDEEGMPLLLDVVREGNAPQAWEAANGLGRLALLAERPRRALEWFEEMAAHVTTAQSRAIAHLNLGLARLDLQDWDRAHRVLQRALDAAPESKPSLAGHASLSLTLVGLARRDHPLVKRHAERAITYLRSPELEDAPIFLRVARRLAVEDAEHEALRARILALLARTPRVT